MKILKFLSRLFLIGLMLTLVGVTGCAQNTPSSPPSENLMFHTVRSGETLETIAKMYGITSHELALINGIGRPYTVYPGQKLKITSR